MLPAPAIGHRGPKGGRSRIRRGFGGQASGLLPGRCSPLRAQKVGVDPVVTATLACPARSLTSAGAPPSWRARLAALRRSACRPRRAPPTRFNRVRQSPTTFRQTQRPALASCEAPVALGPPLPYLPLDGQRSCRREAPRVIPGALPQPLVVLRFPWWAKTVSNRRPPACKAGALPLSYSPLGVSIASLPARSQNRARDLGALSTVCPAAHPRPLVRRYRRDRARRPQPAADRAGPDAKGQPANFGRLRPDPVRAIAREIAAQRDG